MIPEQYEIFMSLDLEMNQPSGNIIQIGAAVGNIKTFTIIDRFNSFVKLEDGEELSEDIKKLTKISNRDLKPAPELKKAFLSLCEFHKRHQAFSCPVSWGSDALYLKERLRESSADIQWPFGYDSEFNLKKIHQFIMLKMSKNLQGGMPKIMTRYGICFEGKKHNAYDDAFNLMRLFFEMLKK